MTCERCGKEMPDNMAICPSCGTITPAVQGRPQPPTNHGSYPPDGPPMGGYGQGYSPQPGYMQPPQPGYPPLQQGYTATSAGLHATTSAKLWVWTTIRQSFISWSGQCQYCELGPTTISWCQRCNYIQHKQLRCTCRSTALILPWYLWRGLAYVRRDNYRRRITGLQLSRLLAGSDFWNDSYLGNWPLLPWPTCYRRYYIQCHHVKQRDQTQDNSAVHHAPTEIDIASHPSCPCMVGVPLAGILGGVGAHRFP